MEDVAHNAGQQTLHVYAGETTRKNGLHFHRHEPLGRRLQLYRAPEIRWHSFRNETAHLMTTKPDKGRMERPSNAHSRSRRATEPPSTVLSEPKQQALK